ncbi:MAG: DEAD/DEAH box helicase [Saprospiraceae bacterium]|nr:DEAD/DEAH box helicase [Saprospiraceae bacterium]
MNNFKEAGFQPQILKALDDLGFSTPTPIQAEAFPILLSSSQDILAFAQTGTGKTAAFGLPAVQLTDVEDKFVQTLILCPTRELCLQITSDLQSYSKYIKGLEVLAVYGGSSMDTQIRALKKGAQIVVGTPGRVKDLINRNKLVIDRISRVILDEADEMLSMGFQEDLDEILVSTPEEKQTLLFSATMSKRVEEITNKYLHNPAKLTVAKVNTAAKNVSHVYYMVHARDKYEVLKRIADLAPTIYGIVFCRTRKQTKEIASKLMGDGYNADALHGDMSQAQRDEVMARFRSRQLQILVATDVAARGLDVDDLTHVINFELPDDDEVYIHRSGRTGRAGKSGISIAIIHTRESRKLKDIEHKGNIRFEQQMVPTGKEICTQQLYALIDKIEKVEVDERLIEPFLPHIYEKLSWLDREQLIKHFVSAEFNRFLAYYKNARDINIGGKSDNKKEVKGSPRERRSRGPLERLFINVGNKDNLTPHRLIGFINEALDSGDANIGKIEIYKKFSFFEIDPEVVEKLVKNGSKMAFEGVEISIEPSKDKPTGAFLPKKKKSKRRNDERPARKKGGGRRDRRK